MALRRAFLAAAALAIAALAASFGGLGPGDLPEARAIRSMTVDAPFQAPEPTTETGAAPGVTEVEPATAPDATAPDATATGSIDLIASSDARIALLALVAIVGFGAGLGTLRAAPNEGRRRSALESPPDAG